MIVDRNHDRDHDKDNDNRYSRTPVTQTLTGNEKLFELAGFRVIGVD